MKKGYFFSLFLLVVLACDMSVAVGTSASPVPPSTNTAIAATIPSVQTTILDTTPTTQQMSFEGLEVAVDPLHVVLSPALASGARGQQVPRAEGDAIAPWEVTPGHIQLKLDGYPLQDKFHEPEIYVYPAQAYAEMFPAAFESIHRLNNILYVPGGPVLNDQLPYVPFFNAQPIFTTNVKILPFQNGQGVRFLTEYSQYNAPANNQELFYHYQGLTNDGAYYVIAILPISLSVLAESSDPTAALPDGIVPYPNRDDPNANWPLYYKSVTEVLNATPPENFAPTIDQLDALIGSMKITQ